MLHYFVCVQACLGAKAKSSEKNIVEVTTTDSSDSSVTHTILNLQSGRLDQVNDTVHPHSCAFCFMVYSCIMYLLHCRLECQLGVF